MTLITSNGIALRTPVVAISQMSRMTRGVRIVNPDGGDTVAAMARLAAAVEAEGDQELEARTLKPQRAKKTDAAIEGNGDNGEAEIAAEVETGNGDVAEAHLAAVGDGSNDAED